MNRLFITISLLILALTGCATAHKINNVQLGMTKQEVIATIGNPISISAQGNTEYLSYRFSETNEQAFYGFTTPYFIRLVNGKVEAYGRHGDFDSAKPTTIRIESDSNIRIPSND